MQFQHKLFGKVCTAFNPVARIIVGIVGIGYITEGIGLLCFIWRSLYAVHMFLLKDPEHLIALYLSILLKVTKK